MSQEPGPAAPWLAGETIPLRHEGITPIATCHWQWVANVFAADGRGDYWDRLGLAWGCRWRGTGVLFGSMDWPVVLRQAFGAVVSICTFPHAGEARHGELSLSARGLPFIAEVDQFYLGPGGQESGHVVHVVLVAGRTPAYTRIVDSWAGPRVTRITTADYELMRASECQGRVEPYKIYAVLQGPARDPAPDELLDIVRQHLKCGLHESQQALRSYIAVMRDSDHSIDVCRVAGERYQAARLFRYFADQGIRAMESIHHQFAELSDDWYLLHVLASHERGMEARARERQLRLLDHLMLREFAIAQAVLA